MVDGLSKVVAVFIAVILLFIYPITYMADNQEESMRLIVQNATVKFTDSVRDNGYITGEMYDSYLMEIGVTGCSYDVEMDHSHRTYFPIYSDVSDPNSFTGDYKQVEEGYFTDEIISAISSGGTYYLTKGDYIVIEVANDSKTFSGQMKSLIFGNELEIPTIFVRYGGQVRYENY